MAPPSSGSPALTDDDLPGLAADLGLPGIFDVHTHFMPERMQAAVWAHFDELVDPSWPIHYRLDEGERVARLAKLGITRYTALAYAHRPGVAGWRSSSRHRCEAVQTSSPPEPSSTAPRCSTISVPARSSSSQAPVRRGSSIENFPTCIWTLTHCPPASSAAATYSVTPSSG